MKFIYLSLLFLCVGAVNLSAQISLELRTGYNDDLCPGFTEANQAMMDIQNMPPIVPSPNTSVEYYWVVEHEANTWTWQTDNPSRPFLIPFAGAYRLRVQVLYISVGNNFPYAAFWSTPLQIVAGEECD